METISGSGRVAAALLISLMLAGCSGGDGSGSAAAHESGRAGIWSPPRISPVAGHYHGSATDTITGEVLHATAFIDATGEAQLIVSTAFTITVPPPPFPAVPTIPVIRPPPGGFIGGSFIESIEPVFNVRPFTHFVVYGNVCCESNFDGEAQALSFVDEKSDVRIAGELSSDMLTGTFDYQGRPYSFSLAPSPGYDEALTLQDLAGVYTNTVSSFSGSPVATYAIVVTADGTVTGSHYNGCIYNGTVSIPDTSRNMFRLEMQLSNCSPPVGGFGPRNGEYTGLGVLLRNVLVYGGSGALQDIFYYSLIGPVWLGTQGAER